MLISILILSLLVGLVSAVGSAEFVDERVVFEADYSQFNDEDQKTISETGTFTLKNDGDENIIIQISFENLPSDYSYNIVGGGEKEIPLEDQISVSYSIEVPHEEGAGEEIIGQIVVKDGSDELDRVDFIQDTLSMLSLEEFEITYIAEDNDQETDSFDESDDEHTLEKDVKPETEMSFYFEIENLFDDRYDYGDSELERIKFTIDVDDNDLFAENFEEEYELPDLRAEKKDDLEVSFTISEEAEAGDYSFDITIEAEDGTGARYKIEKELNFKVRRERNDIRIVTSAIEPETVTACDSGFFLNLGLKNFGTKIQRFSAVSVYNNELEINYKIEDIELEKFSARDNSWSKQIHFNFLPSVEEKTYGLDLTAYINRDIKIDLKRVNLVVESCSVPDDDDITPPEDDSVNQPGEDNTTTTPPDEDNQDDEGNVDLISSGAVIQSIEDPITLEDVIVATLLVAIVIALGAIVILIIILLKK